MDPENTAARALLGLTTSARFQVPTPIASKAEEDSDGIGNSGKNLVASTNRPLQSPTAKHVEKRSAAASGTGEKRKKKKRRVHVVEPSFPVPPRIVQAFKVPKTHVDHSYRDFSSVPPEEGYKAPTEIKDMTFAQKLHHMLSSPECSHAICWAANGRSFRILVPSYLEQDQILERYFGHSRYSSFLSQLRNYGLKALTKHPGHYYHEMMLRGLFHLTSYMPEYKEGRKPISDPDHEPDLDAISALWPVPPLAKGKKLSNGNVAALAGFLPSTIGTTRSARVPSPQNPVTEALASLIAEKQSRQLPSTATFMKEIQQPNLSTVMSSLLNDWSSKDLAHHHPTTAGPDQALSSLIRSCASSVTKPSPPVARESDIASLIRSRMAKPSSSSSAQPLVACSSLLPAGSSEVSRSAATTKSLASLLAPPPVATTESQVESLIRAHFDHAAAVSSSGSVDGNSSRRLSSAAPTPAPPARVSLDAAAVAALLQGYGNGFSKATRF